ncbi:sensor histidine kinase [Pseudaminobacter sp. NGMCC 1.201702]|uniref:sensor histidine kinase n=1 Tax=Pseudaminobacter sp. NGMCC 1.201702 TaxID=3391825 RepID=UPI0039EEB4B8
MSVLAKPDQQGLHLATAGNPSNRDFTHEAIAVPNTALERTLGSFWRAQTAGWLFGAVFGFVSRIVAFQDVPLALALTAVLEPLGFSLTALAHWIFRDRIRHGVTLTIVAVALVLSVVAGLGQMLVADTIKMALLPQNNPGLVTGKLVVPAVYYTLVFMGWSLAYLWINAEADARTARFQRGQAREVALRAELNRLRSQLDSHFLFNALNVVAMEIPESPDTALEMTKRVAAYLRYSLAHHGQRLCPLAEELEAMRNYLRIQELRFESRLDYRFDIEPNVEDAWVPHLILQPLVENAVKHGLATADGNLAIAITAGRRNEQLALEIRNSGQLERRSRDRPAVGLANTRRRLELHYPDRHRLTVNQAGDDVVVRLTLWGSACFA